MFNQENRRSRSNRSSSELEDDFIQENKSSNSDKKNEKKNSGDMTFTNEHVFLSF